MAWPPPTFPINYSNTTAQQDNHPSAHNDINNSLNQDFRPKIDGLQTGVDDNAAQIITNNNAFEAHRFQSASSDVGPINDNMTFYQLLDGSIGYQVKVPMQIWKRHGVWFARNTSTSSDATLDPVPTTSQSTYEIGWDPAGSVPAVPGLRSVAGWMTVRRSGSGGQCIGALQREQNSQDPDRSWRLKGVANDTSNAPSLGAALNVHPVIVSTQTEFNIRLYWPVDYS